MLCCGMLRRAALVSTDVLEELSHSFIRMTIQSDFLFLCSARPLLVTDNVVPSSPNLVSLKIEALRSSETSVITRATRHNVPEDGILHSHHEKTSNLP
jgi:phosphotransacetylase